MPPSSSKSPLSPSELAQLEHAFATEPTSNAYLPLAEAYLAMGRFMEAMVVCKKGVKAHPDSPTPRVLLARVYADQAKDKKALDELKGALQAVPNDLAALRMTGGLLFKIGDTAGGTEHLQKALGASPSDAETLELCRKHGVPVPAAEPKPAPVAPQVVAAAPAPAAVPAAAPVAAPSSPTPSAAAAQVPVLTPSRPNVAQANTATGPAAAPVIASPRPAPAPRPSPRQNAAAFEALSAKYGDQDDDAPQKRGGNFGLIATVALILVGALGLGGYYFHAKASAERDRKIERLLKQVQDELAHDSYAGYKKACEYGETIINDLDNNLFSAHAHLAYAYAIRWGEHGEGEMVEKSARTHLERAKKAKTEHSHLIAAEAFIRFFSGDAQGALTDLEKIVEENEQKGRRSTLLMSSLGILQMHSGELDKALKSLKSAQASAPADPRTNAALGNVLRRQGNEFLAANAYEQALRYEKDHAEAQLGVALMAIDSDKLDTAATFVKKLMEADPPPSMRQTALARLAHAIILDSQGKSAEADREQMLAFEADSGSGDLFILKSRRELRAGKVDDAVASIRAAIKLDPKRAGFYVELARVLVSKPGGAQEAVSALEQALKSVPGTPKLLVLLGDAFRAAGKLDQAQSQYEKALTEAKGKLPEATMSLAGLAFSRKEYPKALELYEKAKNEYLSSPERQAFALTEMGRIHEATDDRKKAFDLYKSAIGVDATSAPAYYFFGKLLINDKNDSNRKSALGFLEQYVKLAPRGEYLSEVQKLVAAQ